MEVNRVQRVCIDFEKIIQEEQAKYQDRKETSLVKELLVPVSLPNQQSSIAVGPYFGSPNLRLHVYYPRFGEQRLAYQKEIPIPIGEFRYRHWPKIVKDKWPTWIERILNLKREILIAIGVYHASNLSKYHIESDPNLIVRALCF